MFAPFKVQKAIQASGVLLKTTEHHRMSRLRLLKLLYIADREMLTKTGRNISTDHAVAMKNGPVLSHTYAMIRDTDYQAAEWSRYLRNEGKYNLFMHADPGVSELSLREIEKLQEVACRFEDWDDWEVAEYTHEFDEWRRNQPEGNGMREIPVTDILAAVGLKQHIDAMRTDAEGAALMRQVLSTVRG